MTLFKRAVIITLSFILFTFILVFLPSHNSIKHKDKGYVYKKQVVIAVDKGKEVREYQLWLQNPENAEDKGLLETDSYTYSMYDLCSYYPYNLWKDIK